MSTNFQLAELTAVLPDLECYLAIKETKVKEAMSALAEQEAQDLVPPETWRDTSTLLRDFMRTRQALGPEQLYWQGQKSHLISATAASLPSQQSSAGSGEKPQLSAPHLGQMREKRECVCSVPTFQGAAWGTGFCRNWLRALMENKHTLETQAPQRSKDSSVVVTATENCSSADTPESRTEITS